VVSVFLLSGAQHGTARAAAPRAEPHLAPVVRLEANRGTALTVAPRDARRKTG